MNLTQPDDSAYARWLTNEALRVAPAEGAPERLQAEAARHLRRSG